MITQFRIKNFKGHSATALTMKQLTVLVGDNGSGKTSVLEALQAPGKFVAYHKYIYDQDWPVRSQQLIEEIEDVLHQGADQLSLLYEGTTRGKSWRTEFDASSQAVAIGTATRREWTLNIADDLSVGNWLMPIDEDAHIHAPRPPATNLFETIALYRFQAHQIAAAAYSDQRNASIGEDGQLTAVMLAEIKLANDDVFDKIEDAMRRIVPSLERLRLRPAEVLHPSNPNPVNGTKLYFDFRGAKGVPAHHASQGTLVLLALLTVLYGPRRPELIMLDDFDHSLHPRAQMELMRMIKELLALEDFQETQIVITTHSPYVLDEVPPENVIAFALRDDGTVATKPLSEHPDAPKVNGSLKSGELWSLDPERNWVR